MNSFQKIDARSIMNNPFMNGKKSLPKAWRTFRLTLTADLSDIVQLSMVCEFWKQAPMRSRILDWDNPGSWPDAWTMMHEADFDDSSIALGMFYTLMLSEDQRWTTDRLKLILIRDQGMQIQRLVLLIDNRWLMNLDHGKFMEKDSIISQLSVQQRYRYDGKAHSVK